MNIAILGAGLIGGSIGLAAKRDPENEVTVYDPIASAAELASERGAADRIAPRIADAVQGVELVFVCAPVSAIAETLIEAARHVPAGCVLTDVGSTKLGIVLEVESSLAEEVSFIGGHPIAGSEEAGAIAARADLFEGAHWILTPTDRSSNASYERVHEAVTGLGARVVSLDPRTHDEVMAVVSHLPQLLASTLMDLASEETSAQPGWLSLAGRGFRDMTRLAASNPQIWLDVSRQNKGPISDVLNRLVRKLEGLRGVIERGDSGALEGLLSEARGARRATRDKPMAEDLHEILIPIPDRPGVLAQVTTTIGNLGVNIEDLSIVHGVDGSRGTLTVTVAGAKNAEDAVNALSLNGLVAESQEQ